MTISFFVPGLPAPGGSKKGFIVPGTRHVNIVDDCSRNKDWRATVSMVAFQHIKEPLRCPVRVEVRFYLPRPKGHYRTGKNAGVLKRGAPVYHTIRPDVTKLWRSTEDSLRMIAWCDDAQIWLQRISKGYVEESTPEAEASLGRPAYGSPGAWITIRPEE